jgi:hypothetical protein
MARPLGSSISAGLAGRLAAPASTNSGSKTSGMVTWGWGLRMIVEVMDLPLWIGG